MTSIQRFSHITKKTEPRDSNPKMYITSSRNSKKFGMKQNEYIHKNININKNLRDNLEQIYDFGMNLTERGTSKSKLSKKVQLKKLNITSLKDAEFIEILRNEYGYYTDRPTLVINNGMKTGKYKFIGAKTVLTEAVVPRKAKN